MGKEKLHKDFRQRAEFVQRALLKMRGIWQFELSVLAIGIPRKLDIDGCTEECCEILDQLAKDLKEIDEKETTR